MFAVKATYRGETRKLSFSIDTFPTFDHLCNQLYRIFPISHNYYLSKLLFSPNATQDGRILIGREIHTSDDYNKSIGPYKGRRWPQGLLRFSVYDETPHKTPNASQGSVNPFPWSSFDPMAGPLGVGTPLSTSHIPPPPIIYSSTSSSTSAMDVDHGLEGAKGKATAAHSCCSVQSTKQDIEKLIVSFKEDLDGILKSSFSKQSRTPSPPLSVLPLFPSSNRGAHVSGPADPPGNSPLCSVCAQTKQCSYSICDRCHIVECFDCCGKSSSFCFGSMGAHQWRRNPTPPSMPPWLTMHLPSQASSATDTDTSASMPWSTSFGAQILRSKNATPVAPFIPPPMSPIVFEEPPTSTTPLARPVIHHGVVCDSCENTIEGVRHKCLDCPDYDLCTNCVLLEGAERHNPFHEFFEISTPGRVVIHRVQDRTINVQRDASERQETLELITHRATCDLCDSHIRGDRYKCLDCPDFDTCSNCFNITEIQHPGHSFMRIRHLEDYIKRRRSIRAAHSATCNVCTKHIHGIRFKCMHPDCTDFDLCDRCEAHPIPLHPESHPLLKMKTPDSLVPEVCRHARSPPLDLSGRDNTQPTVLPGDVRQHAAPVPPEVIGSPFVWGYMRAPSSSESNPETPLVQPTLIPRLDEISPSVVWGPSRGEHVLLGSPESAGERNGSAEVNAPTNVLQDGDDLVRTPKRPTWPGSATELAHLMASAPLARERPVSPATVHSDIASEIAATASPFTGEETLLRPPVEGSSTDMQQKTSDLVTVTQRTLATLLSGYQSPSSVGSISVTSSLEVPKDLSLRSDVSTVDKPRSDIVSPATPEESHEEQGSIEELRLATPEQAQESAQEQNVVPVEAEVKEKIYLSAMFVEDVTVLDGQIFPPGAEFMKCWRMFNDSEHDWPETTELVYVAGEVLGMKKGGVVHVGLVKSGTEVEVWTGELKAPDMAGRYVSYWRLRDGNGELFGDSIWIDIIVADAHSSDESDKSIASSLVIMPHSPAAIAGSSVGVASVGGAVRRRRSTTMTNVTLTGGSPTVGTMSLASTSSIDGLGSDTESEASLISAPSDEGELWEDVASSVGEAVVVNGQVRNQPIDYVLLYDDRSSEGE
ncbi:hypothetical protein P691DRAFT_657056 [Macrolepiota fuliginosa MF-IS2]|uniref:ZZ-type domain-containing protein n=1 Tax=Macrolepiota fuliginosa MF-IS2 TaxID=1400762 RepID=A0A9P6C6Y1_9AGAR|nr:hypothetical protein P691DRAFT_657056 [Macrolepiota fuliginosa MF-IS2]